VPGRVESAGLTWLDHSIASERLCVAMPDLVVFAAVGEKVVAEIPSGAVLSADRPMVLMSDRLEERAELG
jgi:hypothetical protein